MIEFLFKELAAATWGWHLEPALGQAALEPGLRIRSPTPLRLPFQLAISFKQPTGTHAYLRTNKHLHPRRGMLRDAA